MAYTRGNLAVKQKPAEKVVRKYRETTKVVVRRSALPIQEKMLYLATVIFCVAIASVIIWRYAYIYELNKNAQDMASATALLQKQTTQNELRQHLLENDIVARAAALGYIEPTDTVPIQVSREKGTAATSSDVKVNN
ncbi:hypothetical protein [Paenibacillus bovis]|uniref:Cell division protein FtsL n=1 Tax=Paenibacillus bovis TaxID=1616788 RepID=A0A172ZJ79_9BACL|nr:hypothetical protein [Paenibacillus bovis]ANF97695.1 hypothetical protein AR543_17900 [Paenibacillus bovis]